MMHAVGTSRNYAPVMAISDQEYKFQSDTDC